MTKSEIFIELIKSCKRKDGSYGTFTRYCLSNPREFFKRKGLEGIFSLLDEEDQNMFSDQELFFQLLIKYSDYSKKCSNVTPQCKICGNKVDFMQPLRGYKNTCCKECSKEYQKQIVLELYGVENVFQSEAIKNKIKKSNLEKYGVDNPSKSPAIQKKKEETCLKNYGVTNPGKLVEKREETYFKRTGYRNPSQNPNVKKQKADKFDESNRKRRKTRESNGTQLPLDMLDDYTYYRTLVWKETYKTLRKHKDKIKDIEKRSLEFHLDHNYSIVSGFKNNILPHIIAGFKNLRIITRRDNCSKGGRCDISLEEIL